MKTGVAVMDFSSRGGGLDEEKLGALADLLANEIRRLGAFEVIGRADVAALLSLEQQKMLLGCSDDSCLAEIGGALGVPLLVTGSLARFGDSYLLNLKLLDVVEVKVTASVSRRVEAREVQLMAAMPIVVRELMAGRFDEAAAAPVADVLETPLQVELRESRRGFGTWGYATFFGGVGLAVLGGVALGMAKREGDAYNSTRDPDARDASLAWEGAMWTGFAAGAALMISGAVLWSLAPEDADGSDDGAAVTVGLGPDLHGGLMLGLGGRW